MGGDAIFDMIVQAFSCQTTIDYKFADTTES